MIRANWLGAPAFFNLNQACRALTDAFGFHVYLVGSALERRDYRDVDVRCILEDAEYDALFPGGRHASWTDAKWSLFSTSISEWLSARTGLPVDFQFQRQTQANANYPGSRHPIGLVIPDPPAQVGEEHP